MRRALLLLARAVLVGVLVAHTGGVLLFALTVAVEAADEPLPALWGTLRARVPGLWAQAAAVLGGVGVAGAALRLRRRGVVLALGALGVDPRVLLVVGALLAGAVGGLAGAVPPAATIAPGDWVRGEGGWIRGGVGWPDAPGGVVRERPAPWRSVPADVVNAAAAGACGAALGLWATATPALVLAAVLLVVDVVARGLAERGAVPAAMAVAPAALAAGVAVLLLLRAPLFPRRWG